MKARERRIPVRLASGSYGVHIAPSGPQLLVRHLSRRRRPWLAIMDENVRRLHWQALARKWDCALLGPSYKQGEKQDCHLWCDPRNGSHKTLRVCTQCIRSGSVRKTQKQAPFKLPVTPAAKK